MELRKEKVARIKLYILDQTLKIIGRKPFEDLYISELCKRIKISKVTLFHYFPQKEDILLYYFRLWCFKRNVEFYLKPKEGMAGIFYLGDRLCEEAETYPGMIFSLLGYLTNLKRQHKPFPVKAEEKILLFPEIKEVTSIEIKSLEQMLEGFVLEGIFKKEITRVTSTRDLTHLIGALFYGSLTMTHLMQHNPAKNLLRRNIEMALKGIE